jgi:DNA-binding LacI/PurR family transcriptional regulator
LAVQHLAQQGHRRIGFLAAAAPIFSYQYELRRGFCEAVRTLGLEEDEDLVRPREDEHGPDLARALKSLLNEKATAIVFGEPGFGPGYRGFISMAGITIPSDMALAFCELVPFDLTGLNAGLVHLAYERVGIEGVNLLKDLVGQPSHPAARILVKPSLVVQKGGDLAGQETVSVPHNERLQT